jgi:hypothetical protein
MELMEVYHEAMATWIIARVTSGKCEGIVGKVIANSSDSIQILAQLRGNDV